jgi:hypothetical protein
MDFNMSEIPPVGLLIGGAVLASALGLFGGSRKRRKSRRMSNKNVVRVYSSRTRSKPRKRSRRR